MRPSTLLVSLLAAAMALTFSSAWADSGNAAAGQKKFDTAGCTACHGKDGNGTAPNYPALAGQYSDYIVQVLHEYKDGERTNPIMKGMAGTLTNQDIDNIAAYLSGLPSKLSSLHGKIQGSGDGIGNP
ncbi:MAG TPA: cytochrome c [Rhodanobacteraceae bacterium]